MPTRHSYGLSWVDEDELFEVTKQIFSECLGLTPNRSEKKPPDIFSMVVQAKATNTPIEHVLAFEETRALNKKLSNAVGVWHQKVLGLSQNWTDLGASGGGVDLRTVEGYLHPKWSKPLFAEVKNRYNTIKGVNEKDLWDQMDLISKTNKAVVYLFQIIPRKPIPYDKAWKPSGRYEKETIRVCDGTTAYEIVFGYPNALGELYEAFPAILDSLFVDAGKQIPDDLNRETMLLLKEQVLPPVSAYDLEDVPLP